MPHDDHYHVHSDPGLPPPDASGQQGPPSNASVSLQIPLNIPTSGTVTQSFYSLERDLAQLRLDAAGKGILSPKDRVEAGTTAGENPKKILALVIGGNLWPGPGPVPKILIVGCHHAREWISVEVPYLLAEYLIGKYDPNPGLPADDAAVPGTPAAQAQRIKHLVGNREIWFIPMLNAEGHDHTILTSRKWRPNRATTTIPADTVMRVPKLGGGHRTFSVKAGDYLGVDINRNYASSTWGQETNTKDGVTSRDPRDCGDNINFFGQNFCGLTPESESETAAIAGLMESEKFSSIVSYHNFAETIVAPDLTFHDRFPSFVGKGMKKLIAEQGAAYNFETAAGATTGDTLDFYVEKVPGRRPGYTVELSPPSPAAIKDHKFSGLPETEIGRVFRQNLAAALALINCAGFSSAPTSPSTTLKIPGVVTVIGKCWDRFKGWDPRI